MKKRYRKFMRDSMGVRHNNPFGGVVEPPQAPASLVSPSQSGQDINEINRRFWALPSEAEPSQSGATVDGTADINAINSRFWADQAAKEIEQAASPVTPRRDVNEVNRSFWEKQTGK